MVVGILGFTYMYHTKQRKIKGKDIPDMDPSWVFYQPNTPCFPRKELQEREESLQVCDRIFLKKNPGWDEVG